ncbi:MULTISPECIES: hypothetical protein [Robiginitalea]|uniref:Lipoprotein n=1 Tax=Robiginitalea biformata (strain ATCC BAA-864 / DSM 15991 / KCTC 12146 / HTCC2501) TaxID=313596 RepID=A4CM11_ROBBH|nr:MULTISPECIES: hypothetical protein [Robiginitalea]EAR14703.1 hypothetical protein RB2501_10272 [Robiginitalea biformata HTCC2501]MDC6355437.1 hypothetical protein [Robiginitalea sp. PM2]MDC6375953.1 hypothetical protein [Robiginitalea sp. SP8]
MKKLFTLTMICLFGFCGPLAYPSAADPAPVKFPGEVEKAQLQVVFGNDRMQQTFRTDFLPVDAFESLEFPLGIEKLREQFTEGELCKVSITVTVRVGIDSSYAEASMTVSDVSCDLVAATIKRMKSQLLAALK